VLIIYAQYVCICPYAFAQLLSPPHLEVPVNDVEAVQVLQTKDELSSIEPHLRFGEHTVLCQVVMQIATWVERGRNASDGQHSHRAFQYPNTSSFHHILAQNCLILPFEPLPIRDTLICMHLFPTHLHTYFCLIYIPDMPRPLPPFPHAPLLPFIRSMIRYSLSLL